MLGLKKVLMFNFTLALQTLEVYCNADWITTQVASIFAYLSPVELSSGPQESDYAETMAYKAWNQPLHYL